jgi:hypothetical protein
VRQFPRHHRILTRKKVKKNENNACIVWHYQL